MRVRVGQNLSDFNLPRKMDRDERVAFKKIPAFEQLKEDYDDHDIVSIIVDDFTKLPQ